MQKTGQLALRADDQYLGSPGAMLADWGEGARGSGPRDLWRQAVGEGWGEGWGEG